MHDVMSLDLLAVLTALLLLFLGAAVATRRAPNEYVGDDAHGWQQLSRELDRSRRFDRTFSLIRVGLEGAEGGDEGLRTRIESLARSMRSIDSTWKSGTGLYLLLPETDRQAAATLGMRIRRVSPTLLPDSVSIVSFPDDGITSGALLEALDAAPERRSQPWAALVPSLPATEPLAIQAVDAGSDVTDDRGR
jgi:hypothetical protein